MWKGQTVPRHRDAVYQTGIDRELQARLVLIFGRRSYYRMDIRQWNVSSVKHRRPDRASQCHRGGVFFRDSTSGSQQPDHRFYGKAGCPDPIAQRSGLLLSLDGKLPVLYRAAG